MWIPLSKTEYYQNDQDGAHILKIRGIPNKPLEKQAPKFYFQLGQWYDENNKLTYARPEKLPKLEPNPKNLGQLFNLREKEPWKSQYEEWVAELNQ